MPIPEKRNFVRWKVRRPARFKVLNQQEQEEEIGLLRDISFSGAQCSLLRNLRLNDKLDMSLEIPDEQNPICCQAKVVWQDLLEEEDRQHFVCGLSFLNLKDQDKEKIFQYVWNSAPGGLKKQWSGEERVS